MVSLKLIISYFVLWLKIKELKFQIANTLYRMCNTICCHRKRRPLSKNYAIYSFTMLRKDLNIIIMSYRSIISWNSFPTYGKPKANSFRKIRATGKKSRYCIIPRESKIVSASKTSWTFYPLLLSIRSLIWAGKTP